MWGIEILKKNWERDEDRGDKQESGLRDFTHAEQAIKHYTL